MRRCVTRELMPKAHDTPLDRHPTSERTVAVAAASLTELKQAGKRRGGTVNDVVLCAVAGGLRSWLEYHDGPLEGVTVKVPVSLHDHDERSGALGNHDSFMVIDVGTDEPDPLRRLETIAAQTRDRKTTARRPDARSRVLRNTPHLGSGIERDQRSGRAVRACSRSTSRTCPARARRSRCSTALSPRCSRSPRSATATRCASRWYR